MMKIFSVIPMFLVIILLIGCGSTEKREEATHVEYNVETISLETMKCQMCASFVQQAASKVEGVEKADVDLQRKIGTVSFDPGKTTLKDIEMAIAKAGYHANDTKRDEVAYAQLPDCCR